MKEGDAVGMEVETGACRVSGTFRCFGPYGAAASVEEVAQNRAAEAAEMGGVDSELMGAAGMRVEQDIGRAVLIDGYDFIFCQRVLSLSRINLLSRTFVVVRA